MDFYDVLDRVQDLLTQRGRVSYRALKLRGPDWTMMPELHKARLPNLEALQAKARAANHRLSSVRTSPGAWPSAAQV